MADSVMEYAKPTTGATAQAAHPYYPSGAYIAGYAANESTFIPILGVFFGACILLFTLTYLVAKKIQPSLNKQELLTTIWFVLSGTIHVIFEGYYVVNYETLGSKQTILAQMWKEYAFADSRYLTRDALVFCIETLTVLFWGPGCLIIAALVVLRHPLRFPLQMIVSTGQLYGAAIYYSTAFFEHHVNGVAYSRPEAFYFWFYFVVMNSFWMLIPGLMIFQGAMKAANAFSTVERLNIGKKAQ